MVSQPPPTMTQGILPEGRSGRILACAMAGIVVLVMWNGIALPLMGWYHQRAEALNMRAAMTARMTELAAALPALRQRAATSRPGPSFFLNGANDTVTAAALQDRVQAMATALGATLSSVETLPVVQSGAYHRISVRIATTVSFETDVRLLDAIARATPAMVVDELQLHLAAGARRDNPMLDTAMTVIAYRPEGDTPRKGAR
ncbi:general secretion pathway protein M [Komagataeibacter oboediens DSM 11826]|uniref:General secretion pathway protein GspM n=1 Tax=Komagataeibacter oboediens TaxID=65958 RepID=A0A318QX38_9PROT|nr:type II secretion system protein GspM [Komagataeibacter oboediens]PYD82128.1 hypothetical protein CFR80_07855 [Komagataeibacter oboediens]GBR36557.1 general secretion pathway protein M [Komagataeibacter oboediens DSM 11826]